MDNQEIKKVAILEMLKMENEYTMKLSFEKVYRIIEKCRDSKNLSSNPLHLLIIGETGVGKTHLIRKFIEKEGKEKILFASSPIQSTIKSLLEEFLYQVGDPFPERGTVEFKLRRLIDIINAGDVQLIILDDIQHIYAGNEMKTYEVLDLLVQLMDQTNVPFIFLGLENTQGIVKINERLCRRVSLKVKLNGFNVEKKVVSN